jgi:hypothetical protein
MVSLSLSHTHTHTSLLETYKTPSPHLSYMIGVFDLVGETTSPHVAIECGK